MEKPHPLTAGQAPVYMQEGHAHKTSFLHTHTYDTTCTKHWLTKSPINGQIDPYLSRECAHKQRHRTCLCTYLYKHTAHKLRHAAFSETHTGAHTYVLTWVRVHTHELLRAAPSAYSRNNNKPDDGRSCPCSWNDKACPTVLPSERADSGCLSVCAQSRSVRHIYEHSLPPRQTRSLTYPVRHFSVVTRPPPLLPSPDPLVAHSSSYQSPSFSK